MTNNINKPTTPESSETKISQTQTGEVFNTILLSEIMDSINIDISDVAGGFNKIFKNDLGKIFQDLPNSVLEDFRGLQIICAEKMNGSTPTDFEGVDLAMEGFLKNPKNKQVLVSFMPKEYLLEHKSPIFNYLVAKDNINFLQLPFTPQGLVDFFKGQNRNEEKGEESYTAYRKIITSYIGSIFHALQGKIQNFETMDVKDRLESIYDILQSDNFNSIKEKQDKLISLTKIEMQYLKEGTDKDILKKIADIYVKAEQDHKYREEKSKEMISIIESGKIRFIVDYTKPGQKYVLLINPSGTIVFASKDLEWHKDIVSNIGEEKKSVLGGGRIQINDQEKTFRIYDRSGDFGKVGEEANKALTLLINSQYPNYKIIIK